MHDIFQTGIAPDLSIINEVMEDSYSKVNFVFEPNDETIVKEDKIIPRNKTVYHSKKIKTFDIIYGTRSEQKKL